MHKVISLIAMVIFGLIPVGCKVLPSSGPYSQSFAKEAYDHVIPTGEPESAAEQPADYVLVDVDRKITNVLARFSPKPFEGKFSGSRNPADIRIGVGDTVRVTIFEAGSGGLFIPTGATFSGGNFINVPDQQVDRSGRIKVPYAGLIRVVGLRPAAVATNIENVFSGIVAKSGVSAARELDPIGTTALDPRVIVTLPNRTSNLITVLGDVNESGRFNINLGGDRILDAIGLAKGATYQDYETLITLQRGGSKATVRLSAITRDPKNDIYLFPHDVVYVKRDQRFFTILGATGSNSRTAFDSKDVTVANALASAGGLIDGRADAHTVVVYRREPRSILEKMGANTPPQYENLIPTVYRLNLRKPSGYFLAQSFNLRGGDLIYVSNAPIIEWIKVLDVINAHSSTVLSTNAAVRAID